MIRPIWLPADEHLYHIVAAYSVFPEPYWPSRESNLFDISLAQPLRSPRAIIKHPSILAELLNGHDEPIVNAGPSSGSQPLLVVCSPLLASRAVRQSDGPDLLAAAIRRAR